MNGDELPEELLARFDPELQATVAAQYAKQPNDLNRATFELIALLPRSVRHLIPEIVDRVPMIDHNVRVFRFGVVSSQNEDLNSGPSALQTQLERIIDRVDSDYRLPLLLSLINLSIGSTLPPIGHQSHTYKSRVFKLQHMGLPDDKAYDAATALDPHTSTGNLIALLRVKPDAAEAGIYLSNRSPRELAEIATIGNLRVRVKQQLICHPDTPEDVADALGDSLKLEDLIPTLARGAYTAQFLETQMTQQWRGASRTAVLSQVMLNPKTKTSALNLFARFGLPMPSELASIFNFRRTNEVSDLFESKLGLLKSSSGEECGPRIRDLATCAVDPRVTAIQKRELFEASFFFFLVQHASSSDMLFLLRYLNDESISIECMKRVGVLGFGAPDADTIELMINNNAVNETDAAILSLSPQHNSLVGSSSTGSNRSTYGAVSWISRSSLALSSDIANVRQWSDMTAIKPELPIWLKYNTTVIERSGATTTVLTTPQQREGLPAAVAEHVAPYRNNPFDYMITKHDPNGSQTPAEDCFYAVWRRSTESGEIEFEAMVNGAAQNVPNGKTLAIEPLKLWRSARNHVMRDEADPGIA